MKKFKMNTLRLTEDETCDCKLREKCQKAFNFDFGDDNRLKCNFCGETLESCICQPWIIK